MHEWKFYIHTFLVIALVSLAASLLWMLWPVLAALLVGLGVYLVVAVLLRVFHVRMDCSLPSKSPEEQK